MNDALTDLKMRRAATLAERARSARANLAATLIGITGSSGKSTTAALLAHLLSDRQTVFPHSVQGSLQAAQTVVTSAAREPGYVVVEAGIGQDPMAEIATTLSPDVAIVTMVAMEHKSVFKTITGVAAEKAKLLDALRPGGLLLLNGDDPIVAAMQAPAARRTVRFGRNAGNEYRAEAISAAFPRRLTLTVAWPGGELPLATRFVAEHFWLPVTAAVAAALELGVPPERIAARIASFEPLLERCGVFSIPDGPHFILDTVKAPWHSLKLAFDMMAPVAAPRRRVVLGQMSDFAGWKYHIAYRMAREVAEEVVFVGDHAHRAKPPQQDLDAGRFHRFVTPEQVARHIRATAIPGEVILLKGSRNLHLERIALAFVHDVHCWIPACGWEVGCLTCGQYLTAGPAADGAATLVRSR